jgi:transposase-like protein
MYNVIRKKESTGWLCDCPDAVHRKVQCKHVWAVQFSLRIREQVQARVIEPITDIHACLFCKSEQIIKWGLRHNMYGDIQRFSCKSCGKSFTVNLGFERMKHNPQAITTAMQLYFSGEKTTVNVTLPLSEAFNKVQLRGPPFCRKDRRS